MSSPEPLLLAARELLAGLPASGLDSQRMAAETCRLAALLADATLKEGTRAERRRMAKLKERLATSPSQLFTLALTDRLHRSRDPVRALDMLDFVADRTGALGVLPRFDRASLRTLRLLRSLAPEPLRDAVEQRIALEAAPFVLDATPEELLSHLQKRHEEGPRVNLNYLGEEILGERKAAQHLSEYAALLDMPEVDAVSVKLSGVFSQIHPLAFDHVVSEVETRLSALLHSRQVQAQGRLIYFDMEAYRDLEMTLEVVHRLALVPSLFSIRLGVAVQAYLPEAMNVAERVVGWSSERVKQGGRPLRVRLVKGANLAMERIEASARRWAVPVFPSKLEVDANYKRVLRYLVEAVRPNQIELGIASHNLFELAYAQVLARSHGRLEHIDFEMLEGMADPLVRVVQELTGRVLVYAPAVLPHHFPSAIAYLVRRLDENASPENFVHRAHEMGAGTEAFAEQKAQFLASFAASQKDTVSTYRLQDLTRAETKVPYVRGQFENAADTDFTRPWNREAVRAILQRAAADCPAITPSPLALLSGEVDELKPGFDPSRPNSVPYHIRYLQPREVERVLQVAFDARWRWAQVDLSEKRAQAYRFAELLEAHRAELIALMVIDAGKRVQEADVEVSEAVDFARYYAEQMERLFDDWETEPLGLISVIPPWNFPLAIAVSGIMAALLTSNTVIFKPAPETVLVAERLHRLLLEAGVPAEACVFAPVEDAHASPFVQDPRVSAVILTGATQTAEKFLKMRPGLRLFAETGGKNCAYVSALSDREQAISAIVQSAFGHSGQKCSALSVLVLESEVEADRGFREALIDAASSLKVGSAHDFESFVTPLIHPPAGPLAKALSVLDPSEKWWLSPETSPENPRLVSPGIRHGGKPQGFSHLTEFFGPVLSVMSAQSLEEGLRLMNGTPYGLTAGLFSLDEREQDLFVKAMDAGNLYVNRALTGAVVGRQPFGGRKASGFGPGAKAGGPGYLAQLVRVLGRRHPRSSERSQSGMHPERTEGVLVNYADRELLLRWLAGSKEEWLPELLEWQIEVQRSIAGKFRRHTLGTPVLGEQNYLRYQNGRAALFLADEVDPKDAFLCLIAAYASQSEVVLLLGTRYEKLLGGALRETSKHRGWVVIAGSDKELFQRLSALQVERIRLPSDRDDPPDLSSGSKLTWFLGAPSPTGELELLPYFLEQTISVSVHRYGNLSPEALRKG